MLLPTTERRARRRRVCRGLRGLQRPPTGPSRSLKGPGPPGRLQRPGFGASKRPPGTSASPQELRHPASRSLQGPGPPGASRGFQGPPEPRGASGPYQPFQARFWGGFQAAPCLRFAAARARTLPGGPPGDRLKMWGDGRGICPWVWGIPFKGKINVHCIYLAHWGGWRQGCASDVREEPEGLYTSTLHRLLPLSYQYGGKG